MERKKIAVLMASVDREYQTDFVTAAFAAAELRNVDVCVFSCRGYMNINISADDQGESAVFDLPRMKEFDGVISMRATLADENSQRKVDELLRDMRGKPHVSIDVPSEGAVTVLFDDAVSVREMTDHVIRVHHARDIVYLSGPLWQRVAEVRLNACREEMAVHGLTLSPDNIFEGEWSFSSGYNCAGSLISRKEGLPDAVLCGNDDMALGVAEYLQENGYHIPDDVIVTGFDALKEAVGRGLSTIRRPIDEAAKRAVNLLADWMEGNEPASDRIILPTVPVYGFSCGCWHNSRQKNEGHTLRGSRRTVENIMLRISMFNGILASVADETDANRRIDQFVQALNIQELYLCVNPWIMSGESGEKTRFAYSDRMQLLYGRKGSRRWPISTVETRNLIPDIQNAEKPVRLIFCPLYYRDINLGYLAMELNPVAGIALYSELMLLNGALMSLFWQTSMRKNAKALEEMSIRDIMTGMLNRRGFLEHAPKMLEQAGRDGKYFFMISADMDYMKKINDQYGHLTGDQAIIRMGRAMQRMENDQTVAVHISGDEFLVYGITDTQKDADEKLETAREELRILNEKEPWIVPTSASIGLYAAVPRKGDTIDLFLTRADRAMYEDKRSRKAQK